MQSNNYCIIMAGGTGTKFWPLSRNSKPKQFIDILNTGQPLIKQTYFRFKKIFPEENIYIITNKTYEKQLKLILPEINPRNIMLEPTKKNTAPCVAYAINKIEAINPDATVLVSPCDHIIKNEDAFIEIVNAALKAASKNPWLITLGIQPDIINTEYGYIQYLENHVYQEDSRCKKVKTFTEKPEYEMAKQFIQSGEFLWNSGIFVWSLEAINKAFEKYLPEVYYIFKEGTDKYNTPSEEAFISKAYSLCRNISLDYGILEKAENVYVFHADFGWSDLGTWNSLYEIRKKDYKGNAYTGKNVFLYDTEKCIINMPDEKLVVLQGLEDFIVIESDNILLICKKTEEQKIKQFVNDIKIEKGEQYI